MLASMLAGATIVDESEGSVRVAFSASQRAAAAAHLAELKPFFARATGRRDIEVIVDSPEAGRIAADDGGVEDRPVPLRTRSDADLDHPLIKHVAELFDATPRRVEPRNRG